jgi:broad specificity phosphatase PhoE
LADVASSGGESFRQVQERAWSALQSILAGHSGLLLVVAHAGVNRARNSALTGPCNHAFKLRIPATRFENAGRAASP